MMIVKTRTRRALGGLMSLVLAAPAPALERTEAPAPAPDAQDWDRAAGTIAYYNTCNDLTWRWSLGSKSRVGVIFEADSASYSSLLSTRLTMAGITYAGWGYTGTIAVHALDSLDCPVEPPIASQAFYPQNGSSSYVWNVVTPPRFLVQATVGPYGFGNPLSDFVTDHPGLGVATPPACGWCYPTSRVTHSRYFGTTDSPIPCGIPFFDGRCDAELVWEAHVDGVATSATESSTWGLIKALYR